MKVDARDVLDPDGKTSRACRGQILGYFKPTGPNSWDDYSFTSDKTEIIDILPGLKIMMEARGPRFRMRRQGKVIRVSWIPSDQEQGDLSSAAPSALRSYFLQHYVASFDEAKGRGAAAVIALKLDD